MRAILTLVLLAGLTLPVNAQNKQPKRSGSGKAGATKVDGEKRFANAITSLLQRARFELNLDEEQDKKIHKIANQLRKKLQNNNKRPKEILAAMDELKQAREQGDQEKVKEIRATLRDLRGRDVVNQFYDSIKPVLNEQQLAKLEEIRKPQRAQAVQYAQLSPKARLRRLAGQLQLTPEQQPKYAELLKQYDPTGKPKNVLDAETLDLIAEMQTAVKNKDNDRLMELKDRLVDLNQRKQAEPFTAFLDAVAGILTEKQLETLDRVRGQIENPNKADARAILRAARRLDLDRDQKTELRNIEKFTREQMKANRGDHKKLAELDRDVLGQVKAMLNPEQTEKLDRLLAGKRTSRTRTIGGPKASDKNAGMNKSAPNGKKPATKDKP